MFLPRELKLNFIGCHGNLTEIDYKRQYVGSLTLPFANNSIRLVINFPCIKDQFKEKILK